MVDLLKRGRLAQITLGWFIVLTAWWLLLPQLVSKDSNQAFIFGAVYGPTMSLLGGVIGLSAVKSWGGLKSLMGKAVLFLSLGLLAESFGQIVNSYYNLILGVEVLYPSLGDVGFFGNIPLYLFGILFLSQAAGIKFGLRSFRSQLVAIVVPSATLIASYYFFLNGYSFDPSRPLTVILDFGYPLGQALYVSIAFLTYLLSQKILGGIMRNRILLILFAFAAQYFADFSFLYENSRHDGYVVGSYVDYIYLLAYTLMTFGLISLRHTARKIASKNQ